MEDIYPIYRNSFGMSFQWKRGTIKNSFNKIQIIFRDTGFYLTVAEIQDFSNKIKEAKERGKCSCCEKTESDTRSILLRTPSNKVDLAVSQHELSLINELVQGTLFHINLDSYLNKLCNN